MTAFTICTCIHVCVLLYTGTDCSILTDRPHWTVMNASNTG